MQKALFLDRDGIINVDYGYVHTIETFEFTEGIFELLKLFQSKGYLLFVVTNQSGIGRGYYTEEAFTTLTTWMIQAFKQQGITIHAVEHCPHTPADKCHCRKPKTGMIDKLLQHYPIDLQNSWMIGDKQSDIDLAYNAKIGKSIAISDKEYTQATLVFETIRICTDYYIQHPNIL